MAVRVRLTRKLADEIDGVDLTGRRVGDVFDLPTSEARLLLAERWALPERRNDTRGMVPTPGRRHDDESGSSDLDRRASSANDRPRRRS